MLKCNEFYNGEDSPVIPGNNAYDVLVTSGYPCGGPCPPGWFSLFGMRQNQGSSVNSAGNLFQGSPLGTDFEAEPGFVTDGYFHTYWHFSPNNELNMPHSAYVVNSSPADAAQIHPGCTYTTNDFTGMVVEFQLELGQLELERQLVVDGGDTQELTELLINTEYQQALETYYELMERSPNLSRTVLMEALASYELPNVLLTEILSSNPTAAKDPTIRQQINDRLIPFDEYQKMMIDQGMFWLSYKEQLESRISQLNGWVDYAMRLQLDEIYSAESDAAVKANEVLILLSDKNTPQYMYEKAEAIRVIAGTSAALSYLESLDEAIVFEQNELTELNDVIAVYALLEQIQNVGLTDLNAVQEEFLYEVLQHNSSYANSLANGVLFLYQKEHPTDEMYIPETENRMAEISLRNEDDLLNFSIYPNPAVNFVTLRHGVGTNEQLYVEILDVAGRSVQTNLWIEKQQQTIVDVSALCSGAYQVRISGALGILQTIPLIINK